MAAYRKLPDCNPGQALDNLAAGGCSLLFGLVFLPMLLLFNKTSIVEWVGTLICLPLLAGFLFFGSYLGFHEGIEGVRKNKKWRQETTAAETTIVDRREIFHEEDGYTAAYSEYQLALTLVPDQQAVCPGETVIWANVCPKIYKKYAKAHAARIYYFPADPLAFVIEGETKIL